MAEQQTDTQQQSPDQSQPQGTEQQGSNNAGNDAKYVPAKDLMALKSQKEQLETELRQIKNEAAQYQDSATKTSTQLQELEKQHKEAQEKLAKLPEVEEQLREAQKSRDDLQTQIAEDIKGSLKSQGFTDDDLKDKSLSELRLMQSTASRFASSTSNSRSRFDGASGGSSVSPPRTGLDKILHALESTERVG